jgi:predicted GTPase
MASNKLTTLKNKADELNSVISEFQFLSLIKSEIENINNELRLKEIIIPLVGEFSSGKSSLINALIGKKVLPIDITPTTFVVNEVRASTESEKIEIKFKDSTEKVFDELFDLSNINYSDASIVKVFTVSNNIPRNLVLVDLPGLSSDISRHNEVVLEYLPKAHCIFIVVDINQGTITKSQMDFLTQAKIVNLPLYLVLTKSDQKSQKEIENVIDYFTRNIKIEFKKVITTSSKINQMKELTDLLSIIAIDSDKFLFDALNKRMSDTCSTTIKQLQEHLNDLKLDFSEIEKKMHIERTKIDKINREMRVKLAEIEKEIKEVMRETIDKFEIDLLGQSDRLANLAFKENSNLEEEFENVIKNASERAMQFFSRILTLKIQEKIQTENLAMDLSNFSLLSTGINTINFVISTVILNLILPGGILYALIGQIALKILQKIPRLARINIITNVVGEILESLAKMLAKNWVKRKIEQAMYNIVDEFKNNIEENCELIIKELHIKVRDEFLKIINDHSANYNQLMLQKRSETEQLEQYKKNVERVIERVKKICIYE